MIIRREPVADVEAITEVTIAAFKNHPISNHTEQFIITALRDADTLTISIVAERVAALVGDPNYYQRFGFKNYPELVHAGVPQEVFLILPFNDMIPQGTIEFHEGFLAKDE